MSDHRGFEEQAAEFHRAKRRIHFTESRGLTAEQTKALQADYLTLVTHEGKEGLATRLRLAEQRLKLAISIIEDAEPALKLLSYETKKVHDVPLDLDEKIKDVLLQELWEPEQ